MHFLYFANEVRNFDQIRKAEGEKVPKREIDLGRDLIEKLSADEFDPAKYYDQYRERFLAMIDQKVKGQEITVAPPPADRGRGKVVDIFAALKQSLEQAAAQNRPATRERTGKAGRKRRKA
jgi:DNA end-binding protein Ku